MTVKVVMGDPSLILLTDDLMDNVCMGLEVLSADDKYYNNDVNQPIVEAKYISLSK